MFDSVKMWCARIVFYSGNTVQVRYGLQEIEKLNTELLTEQNNSEKRFVLKICLIVINSIFKKNHV